MNLYEAIFARSSVRKYLMESLDDKVLRDINGYIDTLEPLFPGINTKVKILHALEEKPKFSGLAYVKAPYYLVIYTEVNKEKSEMNAGYLMQQLVLYLVTRGLGSCYQGMVKKKDKALADEGLECIMVLAFGKPKKQIRARENEANRLSFNELCAYKEQPGRDIKALLDAARITPSAFNGQPWRFVVYENRFHIFSKKPVAGKSFFHKPSELEFGILLANIMVAADELWVEIDFIKLDNITHKTLSNNQYIISVMAKVYKPDQDV